MKKTFQFIVLTCAVSWVTAGIAIWLGLRPAQGMAFTVFGAAYMLIPAGCAIVLQKIHKESVCRPLGISFKINRWFFVAVVVPLLIAFLALGINLLFPGISFSTTYEEFLAGLPAEQAALAEQQLSMFPPMTFLLIQVVRAIFGGCTINAFLALGEELGWRGFLLKNLNGKKFSTVSLIIGTVWGIWHFPLILIGYNYPQHHVIGVLMMTVFCILLTPPMIYIVLKSKSVITAALFHGTVNAVILLPSFYLIGGNDLTNGLTGIAGFIVLLLVNGIFYFYDKFIAKENIFGKIVNTTNVIEIENRISNEK
jgi:membrane protease YdiL (CAAX protease family)